MEKYIDAMIRQNLMQRQAERKKVDEIDIRQFPELTVNWVSGHKLRTETVSNDPAAPANGAGTMPKGRIWPVTQRRTQRWRRKTGRNWECKTEALRWTPLWNA